MRWARDQADHGTRSHQKSNARRFKEAMTEWGLIVLARIAPLFYGQDARPRSFAIDNNESTGTKVGLKLSYCCGQ
jgi:hypothetical protein